MIVKTNGWCRWRMVAAAFEGALAVLAWELFRLNESDVESSMDAADMALSHAKDAHADMIEVANFAITEVEPAFKLHDLLYGAASVIPPDVASVETERAFEFVLSPETIAALATVKAVTELLDTPGGEVQFACIRCMTGGTL